MIQKMIKPIIVFVVMPWSSGIVFFNVRKDGQIAPSITRTVFAPFMVWIANQKMAKIHLDMMATYEPQNPQDARELTGKEVW